MSEQKIILYGAFDRYNYGDILIPIILREYLQKNGLEGIKYFSIKNVDLSLYGGFRCAPLDLQHIPKNSIIIVTGGEVLNVDWTSITSYFMGWFGNRCIRATRLILPRSWINSLCSKIMKGKFKHPYLIEKLNIPNNIKVIYNGVGGVSIKVSDNAIKSTLLDADFVSVRDINANYVLESKWGINNKLTPDIANAVSKFYPKDKLIELTSEGTNEFITKNKNGYLCFQMAKQYTYGQLSTIISSLSKILSKGGSIALLPLGTVSGHEDNKILEKIYQRLPSKKVFILQKIQLFDSISLIAHSRVFTGTSLHGNITAISYAVPHFPLNQYVTKLNQYLEQWDIPNIEPCQDYSKIHKHYELSTKTDMELLIQNRNKLISQIDENIDEMCKIIS